MTQPTSKATVPSSDEPNMSSSTAPAAAETSSKSVDGSNPYESQVMSFFKGIGIHDPNVENYSSKDFYSDLLCNTLKTHTVRRGHVTCFATVKPSIANFYGGLHGGAGLAIAERVAIATARTVVGDDKEIFLVDLGMSYLSAAPKDVSFYLSAAPKDAELIVEGSVVKSGRNITVVLIEFKMKKTGKLVHTSRATFHNSPVSKL